jgi:uncharacterized membrane protein YhaH (DUF805 family)
MNWYMEVLRKYADFNGRARRTEYWMFTLFNILIYMGLGILAFAAIALMGRSSSNSAAVLLVVAPIWLYGLAVIIPGLAVSVRRLHDTGRSGWFILVAFIPFVGGIILLVFTCMDSQPGPNLYGPNPKGVQAFQPMMPPPYPGAYPGA